MDIIFWHPSSSAAEWTDLLRYALPQARVRVWQAGDDRHADYALVWQPPVEMLQGRRLKGVFALGAGVDAIMDQLRAHPTMLRDDVPLFRLEDTGMAQQMQEYAVSQVLRWFRRFDDYQDLKAQGIWQPLNAFETRNVYRRYSRRGRAGRKGGRQSASMGFPGSLLESFGKAFPGHCQLCWGRTT
jgi:glyoxylate/hydroxypyruvate reductase A